MSDSKGEAGSLEIDVENLKVIEIKKRLKALGLPVTGNKPELVERLQLAMISSRDAAASPDSAGDSSPSKVKDQLPEKIQPSSEVMFEDSLDLDQGLDLDQSQEVGQSQDVDQSEEMDQDQEVARSQKVGQSQDVDQSQDVASVSTSVPSKKRVLPQDVVETVKPRKKIILKRNNFPTPILAAKADEGESVVSQSCDIAGMPTGLEKNIVKLTAQTGLSEAEKAKKRAIRFNITADEIKEKVFGAFNSGQTPKQKMEKKAIFSSDVPVPNIDVLKKRGSRFGENVSSVLKKLEVEQKLIHRRLSEESPSGTKTTNTDEEEKKKKRAERFGNI